MKHWKTTLNLNHENGTLTSRPIEIKSGIFQGDSLSPLIFCLALAPLSNVLNESPYGYNTKNGKVNHLLYVDDLKTYAKNDDDQTGLLNIIKTYSNDICMEFGLEKCAKATFKRGKLTSTEDIDLDINIKIKDLGQDGTYKYLGVNEGADIQHSFMKEKIRKEYYRRVRTILKSELNASNSLQAINSLAVPVITYSFNVINWKLSDLQKIDRKTRKMLTREGMHHPKADVDRLYLPRTSGGRGLIQLELTLKTTTVGLDAYLQKTKDRLLQIVRNQSINIAKEAEKYRKMLEVPETEQLEEEKATTYAKRVKQRAKMSGQRQSQLAWEEKALHGKYPKRTKEADVDQLMTHQWLKSSGLKAETEGFIVAAQDQSLPTKAYQHHVLKIHNDPMCRICGKFEETIDHIVSGCPELAKTEYIARHDKVAAYIHWEICKKYGLETPSQWYKHQPCVVAENKDITILWDMPIHTDREIKANRPDIVIRLKKEKISLLIDISVPSDRNTSLKVAEKLGKYKDLEIEISRMWDTKTFTIPVIIGALGLVKKGTEKFIERIPGNIKIQSIQKTALLGTAHILRKVLSIK